MMRRMLRRALLPSAIAVVVVAVAAGRGPAIAVSVGVALALGNLYLAGRVIGGISENAPHLLPLGAMGAFVVGMALLFVAGFLLRSIEGFHGTYAGIALVGMHLLVVTWEAADSLLRMPRDQRPVSGSTSTRS